MEELPLKRSILELTAKVLSQERQYHVNTLYIPPIIIFMPVNILILHLIFLPANPMLPSLRWNAFTSATRHQHDLRMKGLALAAHELFAAQLTLCHELLQALLFLRQLRREMHGHAQDLSMQRGRKWSRYGLY